MPIRRIKKPLPDQNNPLVVPLLVKEEVPFQALFDHVPY